MPKAWFYKRHGIPLPAKGEEVITGKPTAAPQPGFGGGPAPDGPTAEAEEMQARHAQLHAKDATDKIVSTALENLTGVEARWLGGVKPFFAELILLAQSQTVTDEQLIYALNKASRQLPELFGRLKPDALADALSNAMSTAVVNGAARGAMKRKLQNA
jgi:hypothetical protein